MKPSHGTGSPNHLHRLTLRYAKLVHYLNPQKTAAHHSSPGRRTTASALLSSTSGVKSPSPLPTTGLKPQIRTRDGVAGLKYCQILQRIVRRNLSYDRGYAGVKSQKSKAFGGA